MADALDTYFVFLRTRVLTGHLSLTDERQCVMRAKTWIEDQAQHNLALAEYHNHLVEWQPVDEDGDPFAR
jgi:hypothetical protein